jgi:phage shock protein A
MNLLKRLVNALRGKADSVLDQLEDPEEQLSVFVEDMNEQVQSLQQSVAAALADEKRLKMQIEDQLTKAAEWESRAILALQDGNEDLAREALLKKDDLEKQSLGFHKRWDAQKEATEKLKISLQAAKQRVSDAKTKYTLLVAQYKAAATKKKLQETLSSSSAESPTAVIERLTDKIRRIEAETEADLEVSGEIAGDLEAKFIALEQRKKGDQALDALKAQLAERRALPPGSETNPADRISELKAKLDKG